MDSYKKFFSVFVFLTGLSMFAQVGIIKDDFRVNNDSTGNASYLPSTILLPDNSGLIVWQDGRNGINNIYAQMFSTDGSISGSNYKVSSLPGNYSEGHPVADRYGDSVLVSFTNGYAQWLSSNGSQIGSTFSISSGPYIYNLDAVPTDSGIFVVGQLYTSNSYNIYFQRFDLDGNPITDTILVNDDGTSYNQFAPGITVGKNGYIVAVWEDYRNGSDADVYAQLFDKSGNKVGSNFIVNDTTNQNQNLPDIAMDTLGNFVVVWSDYRNGNRDIYAQRYDASANPIGSNFIVNDDGSIAYQENPSISMDESGSFIVAWYDMRDGTNHIYAQIYDNSGNPQGSNFKVTDYSGSENQYDPSVFTNGNRFVIAWSDQRDDRSIYYRVFDSNGTPITSDTKVNDISGVHNQDYPSISINSSGYGVITWNDTRDGGHKIYYSTFDRLGNIIDDNILLCSGTKNDVKIGEDSTIICVTNVSGAYIYYFIVSSTTIDSGEVQDSTTSSRYAPSLAIDSLNNFVVVWYDNRNGNYDIYGQLFTNTGVPVGNNFIVNDDGGTSGQYYPDVAMAPSGKFFVVWEDYRNGIYDIYGQLYNPDGSSAGSNILINDTTGGSGMNYYPSVAYINDGKFAVVWQSFQTPGGIHGRIVDTTGVIVGDEITISEPNSYYPDIASNSNGTIVVTWSQYASGQRDIFARMTNSSLTPLDTIYKVNNNTEGPNEIQDYPAIAFIDTLVYFTWKDPKWQHGYDIAAKVVTTNFLGVEDEKVPEDAGLNIVNPISSGYITINYTVPKSGNVRIELYDISGRQIELIKNGFSPEGTHEITIPATGIISGIYFIRLNTGGITKTSKLLMIK